MKALVYKDLRVLCKDMKGHLLFFALVCFLPWGVLSDHFELLSMGSAVMSALFLPMELKRRDMVSGWQITARTLPYSVRQMVGSRYVIGGLSLLWGFGFYLLGQLVFSRTSLAASYAVEDDFFPVALLVTWDALFLVVLHFSEGELGIEEDTFAIALGTFTVLLFFLFFVLMEPLFHHPELLLAAPLLWLLSIPLSVRILSKKRRSP